MKELTVSAKVGKDGVEHSVTIDFPETLDEMIEAYGEEVVFGQAKANIVVGLQGNIRSRVSSEKDPKTGKALQESFADWKPGTRQPGVAKIEKMKDRISKMSPDEKAALLAELQGGGEAKAPAKAPAKPAAQQGKRR